jgi:S1-C subfamily serine protease
MPEVPDNVPIYISSAPDDDEPVGSSVSEGERPLASREALLEDRSASTWQPYLQPTVSATDKAADIVTADEPAAAEARQSVGFSKRTTAFLVAFTGLNLFAFGAWAGYYLIPREPVTTSLKPSVGNLFAGADRPDKTPANLIADVAAKANPAVVTIDVKFSGGENQGGGPRSGVIPPAEASGLIVRSDGYILTNSHVVHRNSTLKVTLNDRREFTAKVVGRDDYSDLAVLKIEANNLPVLKFADSRNVRPGDWAIAIGAPLGLDHTLTLGVISAINRSLSNFKNRVDLFQHDAALNLGNSGGPLINLNGEVIGINTAVRDQAVCIGFATPSNEASDVATRLIANGQIPRPFLGIYMEDIDPERTRSLTLPSHPVAVRITRLSPGGPAEKAGMAVGDNIVKIGSSEVRSRLNVRQLTQKNKPGDQIDIVVQRGTRTVPLKLTVGDLAKDSPEF